MRLITSLIFILFFIACSGDKINRTFDSYFDTKTFFEEQKNSLGKTPLFIEKEMTFGNKRQLQTIDSINWEKELNAFTSIDLLKPAYTKRFIKDSIAMDNSKYLITYSSVDKKTDVKKIDITYTYGYQKPNVIVIEISEDNTVYESKKTLKYYTDSAFYIEGQQKTKLTKGTKYSVNARFIKR